MKRQTAGRILLLMALTSMLALGWIVLVPHEEYSEYILIDQYETDMYDQEGGLLMKVDNDGSIINLYFRGEGIRHDLEPGARIRVRWISTAGEKRIEGVWPA